MKQRNQTIYFLEKPLNLWYLELLLFTFFKILNGQSNSFSESLLEVKG